MQRKLLEKIFSFVKKFNKSIIIVMTILTIIFGTFIFVPGLKIISSQTGLIPEDHPEQARYLKFIKDFGISDNLIVVIEGDQKDILKAIEPLTKDISSRKKWVKSIFYKIDLNLFLRNAPLFAPVKELEKGISFIKSNRSLISTISKTDNISSLVNLIRNQLINPNISIDPKNAPNVINGLNQFFIEWIEWIKNSDRSKISLLNNKSAKKMEYALKSQGYFFSKDYSMAFIFVQPQSSSDDISYLRPFISEIKKSEKALFANTDLKSKVKIAYTGLPAHMLTETETVYSDISKAGAISIILVTLILLFGFKSIKKLLIAIVPLVAGMILTLGIISITLGRLNLISSSFLAVLFGIGIDFGIYLLRRTEEELGNGKSVEDAIYQSVVVTGQGVLTGGLTTGLAFLALILSDFSGYSELGITAGVGVLVVLITTFLLLPSLLFRFPIKPRVYDISDTINSSHKKNRKFYLKAIVAVSLIFSIFGIYSLIKNPFDYNVLNMLPRDVDSTIYQLKMEEKSDFTIANVVLTTDNLQDMRKYVAKVKKLKNINRIDSLSEYIPDNQKIKIALINRNRAMLKKIVLKHKSGTITIPSLIKSLDKFSISLEEVQDRAFSGRQKKLVLEFEKLNKTIETLSDLLKSNKNALNRTSDFEEKLFTKLTLITKLLHSSLNPSEIKESNFSNEFLSRFKNSKGKYAAYIVPAGSIWNIKFLDKFISSLKKIKSDITGFPVTHKVFVRQAVTGVVKPFLYSLFVVILLLLYDLRNIKLVFLTMIPLTIGMLWLFAFLYSANVSYNVANVAGLPLLLGLGVVYGVHMIHRWRENWNITAFAATHTTGRGVAFSALTTISGLFSIIFARHGGVSSFGFILLFGIFFCLIAALFVLPAIIDLIYFKEWNEKK